LFKSIIRKDDDDVEGDGKEKAFQRAPAFTYLPHELIDDGFSFFE
jgi:hypothetical protein